MAAFRQPGFALLSIVLGAIAFAAPAKPAVAESVVGKPVENFKLEDFRGKEHQLADLQGKKLVVLAFLGVECPLARQYARRLNDLAAGFESQGVAFVGIDSNRQDSLAEMAAFARDHELKFPLLKDAGNALADRLKVERTPEVVLLDAERIARYQGRVDDQYGNEDGISYQRPAATQQELKAAIEELLAGQAVTVANTKSNGCLIGRVRDVKNDSAVTYSNEIARVFNQHCVECHRAGQIAPFALTSYEESVGWADMICEVVRENRMPPWHADPRYGQFANDSRLSDDEKDLIFRWAAAGAPQGDPSQLPDPPQFAGGWQMGREPDAVFKMRDEPYTVPAEGVVAYQYFTVDPGFTEDKWVKIAECLPDNRSVVHHIIVFVRPPASAAKDARGFSFLVGYAPGTRPFECPGGMAKQIPAGSKLVFQMHYTPNGVEQQDCSSVGLVFVDDPAKLHHRVVTQNATNHMFEIPAGDDNYEVKSSRRFRKETTLLSMFPHMHLRGKSFRYELKHPDGSQEILLDVPRYDFNWQNHFILRDFKQIPAGSRLLCTAHFDNSAGNLANPDATQKVRWGDQTWEEMMIGWYDIAVPIEDDPAEVSDKEDAENGG